MCFNLKKKYTKNVHVGIKHSLIYEWNRIILQNPISSNNFRNFHLSQITSNIFPPTSIAQQINLPPWHPVTIIYARGTLDTNGSVSIARFSPCGNKCVVIGCIAFPQDMLRYNPILQSGSTATFPERDSGTIPAAARQLICPVFWSLSLDGGKSISSNLTLKKICLQSNFPNFKMLIFTEDFFPCNHVYFLQSSLLVTWALGWETYENKQYNPQICSITVDNKRNMEPVCTTHDTIFICPQYLSQILKLSCRVTYNRNNQEIFLFFFRNITQKKTDFI